MADNIGVSKVSCDIVTVLSSSLSASDSLNLRNKRSKNLYDQLTHGIALRSHVGEAPYNEQLATPPSWTQRNIGLKHDVIIPVLSSSHHEVSRLNSFLSGQLPLASGHIPVNAPTYYSKSERLTHRIYKLPASLGLPTIPSSIERPPFDGEVAGRNTFISESGSYRSYSYFNPAVFEIDIPDHGKIRDIRVWVEFIHDVRNGVGEIGGQVGDYQKHGLQNVQIALRSPNVHFRSAHPLLNDPQTFSLKHRQKSTFVDDHIKYYEIPELLRGSYLLWAGHTLDTDDIDDTHMNYNNSYISWNTDIDMRTVFCDSSKQPNTRHLDQLFPNANDIGPGNPEPAGVAVMALTGTVSGGAPNYIAHHLKPSSCPFIAPSARGNNTPWFIDPRIQAGGLTTISDFDVILGSNPPAGWLSGIGGSPAADEFLTKGPNLGPASIKPVYPLLDDVFVEKKYDEIPDPGSAVAGTIGLAEKFAIPKKHGKIIGFRPGLRGTEIHGKWKLLIGTGAEYSAVNGMVAHPRSGIWFRQFRLEIIYDSHKEPETFYHSKARMFKKHSYVPTRPGKRRVQILSGSSAWDIGINYTYVDARHEYGRTVGITSNVSSSSDSFAVFSRITGTFLSGSEHDYVRSLYLNNEFGTPFIPISSGSGVPLSFNSFTADDATAAREIVNEVLSPRPLINQANTIKSHIARARLISSTRANIIDSINRRLSGSKP